MATENANKSYNLSIVPLSDASDKRITPQTEQCASKLVVLGFRPGLLLRRT